MIAFVCRHYGYSIEYVLKLTPKQVSILVYEYSKEYSDRIKTLSKLIGSAFGVGTKEDEGLNDIKNSDLPDTKRLDEISRDHLKNIKEHIQKNKGKGNHGRNHSKNPR